MTGGVGRITPAQVSTWQRAFPGVMKVTVRWEAILDDSGGPSAVTSILERGRRVSLRAGGRLEDARLLAWSGRRARKGARGERQKSPSNRFSPGASEGPGPASAWTLSPRDHSGLLASRLYESALVVICYSRKGRPAPRVCPGGLGNGFSHWASRPTGATGATSLWVQQGHLAARGGRV